MLIYFPKLFHLVQSTPNDISLFLFRCVQVEFYFKFRKVTYSMMPYARKIHYGFCIITFHVEMYLQDQFCIKYF